ncbi:MAG: Mfa1 fimbrilin C-terminal domain-containing protein [Muribaculaceae bacterium]|nr:Mfa1 fimbrilin C-terminal domain-containing protein [Muribaculaceae bacterium]
MKKSILLPCIGLILASSCSTEETNFPDDPIGESRSFLSVSLVATKTNSRAAQYQDGTPQENNINTIRFYFFDNEGNATPVYKEGASGTYLSYIDWRPMPADESTGNVSGQTVEKIVNATMGINMPQTAQLPAFVLAVINPTSSLLSLQDSPSLTTLRSIVADHYTGLTENNFVISNSVYADDGSTVDATVIDSSCYGTTAVEAEKNPVIIYVERVLARLDLSINIEGAIELSDDEYIYPASDKPYSVGGQEQEVFVKFLGWNVTSTPNASRLIKNINPQWKDDLFGNLELWNTDNYHRSFWAVNPPANQFDFLFGAYQGTPDPTTGNYVPALTYEIPAPDATATTYLQENAAEYSKFENGTGSTNSSKVILAAQLVNRTGQPLPMALWANRYYTPTGVVNAIANTLNLYRVTTVDGTTTYTQITPADLQLLSAKELYGEDLPDDVSSYFVYVQLADDAEKLTWALGNEPNSPVYTTQQVNTYIINRTNFILLWNEGMTYYYFDIRHIGNEGFPGYLGVVRNHIYAANVTSVTGLGTPVFNPDEIIYPEMPPYDNSVLTAQIRILQWRIVSQDYDLKWP